MAIVQTAAEVPGKKSFKSFFDDYQQRQRGVDLDNIKRPDSDVAGNDGATEPPPGPTVDNTGDAAAPEGGGIVNGVLDKKSTNDFTPSTPGPGEGIGEHAPTTITPGEKSTVSGQMGNLLDENSRYLQLARTNAMQGMNARGLVNSSIAVGSSQDAAIRAALPIAQQDAGTNWQAQQGNQAALNKINEGEQVFDINQSLKEQEQRQMLERLEFDSMTKEDQDRLKTQLEMLSDENKAKLQGEMEILVKEAEVTAQQKQLFAQESSKLLQTTQEKIAEISLNANGNLNAVQQEAAIQVQLNQQDASLKLLKDLMLNSTSWTW